jgi:hypothetical protein
LLSDNEPFVIISFFVFAKVVLLAMSVASVEILFLLVVICVRLNVFVRLL